MGRRPCCAKEGLNRGAWTAMEDKLLREYIKIHGEGKWRNLPKRAGLKRCGKSCRLRWLNYLRPDIKRGNITRDEEDLIIRLHKLLGNRWSLIAGRLPGRTDNEIKNYWNTNIGKKVQSQPTSPTTNRKPSNQSKKNPKQSSGRSSDQPSSPTVGSPSRCVVHTKASRCNKVFIQPDTKPVIGPSIKEDIVNNSNTTVAVPPQPVGATTPFVYGENDPYDFVMNFEVDEKFLSDFLENEFEPLCDLLGALEGDSNTNTSIDTSDSFPHSNQTASFSQEMLHVSDLGSMASLLDAEINWLQE